MWVSICYFSPGFFFWGGGVYVEKASIYATNVAGVRLPDGLPVRLYYLLLLSDITAWELQSPLDTRLIAEWTPPHLDKGRAGCEPCSKA